ncbi:solute carrier family 15 member 5 [Bufo gargarizans]|uniref:solute carrier family 15 member 5 n=1 Tax=Bufo gargarizans TaxID=30331 RepID=UPI001CF43554|nr:solute carrier family 15 member 5 [Bufo gargarizans]
MPLPHFVSFSRFQSSHEDSSRFWRKDVHLESSRTEARKSLQPIICMLLVELFERFTFFATVCNMILFCKLKMGYQYHQAAIANLCFVGACTITPVLIGWSAELFIGRTRVIYICTFLHFAGTVLLPVVAFPFEDFYIDMHHIAHTLARREQTLLFYAGLLMASIGTGGIRAIICPLSAYGLQGYKQKELMSFFNWFYWLVNLNSLVVFVGISYIQQSVAKNLGFLIPFMSIVMALITIHMVRNELIYQPVTGNSLGTTLGVFVNAGRMCCIHYRHVGGQVSSWIDRAKEYNGGRYSVSHVENAKVLLRLLPLFVLQVLYRICTAQASSGYFIQSMNSNLSLNGFLLPIAAMKVISIIPVILLAPCLERVHSFLFYKRGYRQLPCMAIVCGHVAAALSLLIAGIYEIHRKWFPLVEQTLSGKILLVSSMSCLHLAPQYIFLGMAEVMVAPACSFITFCLAPRSIRGVCMAVMTVFQALGCFIGALLIKIVFSASEGDWFPDILSSGHLEHFFFFLASAMLLNSLAFWQISYRYWDLDDHNDQGFRPSLLEEKLLLHEKSLKFYETFLAWPATLGPLETTL